MTLKIDTANKCEIYSVINMYNFKEQLFGYTIVQKMF